MDQNKEMKGTAVPEDTAAAQTLEQLPEGAYCPAVVVMCHKGTLDLMRRIWEERLQNTELIFIENDSDSEMSLLEQIGRALADPRITPGFVLAPANLIPCSEITLDDLMIPVVYVNRNGQKAYNATVPMYFETAKVLALIEAIGDVKPKNAEEVAAIDENFADAYAKMHRTRAIEVGMSFGNFVSPVTRGTPCGNKVIEALMRKKFVSANSVGFSAITQELEMTLKP